MMFRRDDEDGFTLIEIILAILIISIAVVGLTSVISFTGRGSLNAEVMSTAAALAQERMEQLMAAKRNAGYGALALGPAADPPFAAPFDKYSRNVEICLVDAALLNPDCDPAAPNIDAGYKRATVSVNYAGLPDLSSPVASVVTVMTNVRE